MIIFDADTLIKNLSRQLLTSQQLSNMELSHMTSVSEIPWSHIQQHLPDLDLDPSSVATFLKSLGYRPTRHGTLRLAYNDDTTSLSSDIGCSTLAITKWSSIDSGISSVSCLTTSSGASIELDSRLFHQLHSGNSLKSDIMSSGSPILNKGESTHYDTKHCTDAVIKESSIDDVYHGTESYLTTPSKLLIDSDNKLFINENSYTQDTKGTVKLRKQGYYFCHNSRHMIKQYLHCFENIASVPFQDHVTVIEFDASGGEYKNNEHDITLSIPEGAIPHGEIVHIEVAIALYGPFQFSDGKRPISPILWLCPQGNVELLKPITIILSHTLVNLTREDITNFGIQLAKANHREYVTTTEGKTRYVFRPYSVAMELKSTQQREYIEVKANHFCFICLEMNKLGNMTPEVAHKMAMKMGYYLHCIESLQSPYFVSPPREIIHFCVTFFLETCRKAVEEQFPVCNSNGELIHRIHRPQRFTMKQSHQYLQLKHSTKFVKPDVVTVAVSSSGKIYVSSVDFWESEFEEDLLKLLHREKQYPPRLEMTVQLVIQNETQGVILSADFEGVDDHISPNFQFILPIVSQSQESKSTLEGRVGLSLRENTCILPHNGWKCISGNLPHKNDKPKLSQLYCLTRGCTRVQVIKSIAPKWIDLAMVMGYEHSDIESVNITTQRDPLNAARIILGQWLDGSENLCGPVTWSTLIEYLSIIEFQSLADKLNNVLLD